MSNRPGSVGVGTDVKFNANDEGKGVFGVQDGGYHGIANVRGWLHGGKCTRKCEDGMRRVLHHVERQS